MFKHICIIKKAMPVAIFVLISAVAVFVQAGQDKKVIASATKELTGQISAITKGFIAVTYEVNAAEGTEKETAFPIEGSPMLERIKSFDNLKEGDTVTIEFEDVTALDDAGKEVTNRTIKKIKFIKPAPPPRPIVSETPEEEEAEQ